jgi:hypothetical protein
VRTPGSRTRNLHFLYLQPPASAGKTKWLKINGKILLFLIVSWKM